jgi:hypothetical protein
MSRGREEKVLFGLHWSMVRGALFRLLFFVLLSYGFLYFSYKYYVPDLGGSDFYAYYPMYLDPFNYHGTKSPFVYRQLTALIVYFVWKLGVFYDTTISFSREGFDKHVFFAAIFTNYIALTVTATVVTYTTEKLLAQKTDAWLILAGLLLYFDFFVQQAVLTGLTEGISWLLVAIGFLAYINKAPIPICAVLSLSVIQRETIPFVFATFAAVGLLFCPPNQRRFNASILLFSAVCFLVYVFMRSVLIPVSGAEKQLSPSAVLASLEAWRDQMTSEFVFQAILSKNLLILLAAVLAASAILRRFDRKAELEISVFISAFVLIIIGIGAGIGNNVGRILSVLTPIVAPLCVKNLACLVVEKPMRLINT